MMLFAAAARLEIKKGDKIIFMLRNNGVLDHELVLATTMATLKYCEAMREKPDIEHDDPNERRLAAKNGSGNRLDVQQGQRVRAFVSDRLISRRRNGRHDRHQVNRANMN